MTAKYELSLLTSNGKLIIHCNEHESRKGKLLVEIDNERIGVPELKKLLTFLQDKEDTLKKRRAWYSDMLLAHISLCDDEEFKVAPPGSKKEREHGGCKLIKFESPKYIFYAVRGLVTYQIFLGNPNADPQTPTNREWLEDHRDLDVASMTEEDLEENVWWADRSDQNYLDDLMPEDVFVEHGCYQDSPSADSYYYFEKMDLGPLTRPGGGIDLRDGVGPGNDSRVVVAENLKMIERLQLRLNELGDECNFIIE